MAADVEEGAELAFAIEGDDQGKSADLGGEEAARAVELAGVPHVLPGATKDVLPLGRRHGGVDIPRVGKRLDAVLGLGVTHGRVMLSDSDMRKQFSRTEREVWWWVQGRRLSRRRR